MEQLILSIISGAVMAAQQQLRPTISSKIVDLKIELVVLFSGEKTD